MENCHLWIVLSNGNQNSAGSDIDLQVAVDINVPWRLQYKNKEYSFTIAWNPCCWMDALFFCGWLHCEMLRLHWNMQPCSTFSDFSLVGAKRIRTWVPTSTFTSQSVQCDASALETRTRVSSGHFVYSSKPQLNWQPFHNADFGIGCRECCRPSLRYIFRTGYRDT